MIVCLQNKEQYIVGFLFAATTRLGIEDFGGDELNYQSFFNALLQTTLITILLWLMMVCLQDRNMVSQARVKGQLLEAAKERLLPLQELRGRLQSDRDTLAASLNEELDRKRDLSERFRNICGQVGGSNDLLGAGDF